MEEEFSLSLWPSIARPIYLHAAIYRSSDCKRRMLIITLNAYNQTPINDLVVWLRVEYSPSLTLQVVLP